VDSCLDFFDYRSSLNVTYYPESPIAHLPSGTWLYSTEKADDKPPPTVQFTDYVGVPADKAAICDIIGINHNADKPRGPALLILAGGSISLDNMHLRNVILRGVDVHYSGKPIILENVIFISCTFSIENDDQGRELGEELLASSSVNFRSPG
jgi:hypothetical protein